jgi:hypothetical protein
MPPTLTDTLKAMVVPALSLLAGVVLWAFISNNPADAEPAPPSVPGTTAPAPATTNHRWLAFRVGAQCTDGTISTATGSGACSWHGGVARWVRSSCTPAAFYAHSDTAARLAACDLAWEVPA